MSIIESGVSKFPAIMVEVSTSLNLVFSFLLHVFRALFSGTYVSAIVDSFSWVGPFATLSPSYHNLGTGQHGLSGCGIRALEHLLSGSDTSLVAAEHVGS